MKVKSLSWCGTLASRSDATQVIRQAGDTCLIERGHPRLLIMRCPCSCGEDIVINVDPRAGKAWRYRQPGPHITIYPSVWRDTGCQSHFIVWKGSIWWADGDWESDDAGITDDSVLSACPGPAFVSAEDIANRLEADPWSVLRICRRLTKTGRMVEGPTPRSGCYRSKDT
jgi:hypothetical protein